VPWRHAHRIRRRNSAETGCGTCATRSAIYKSLFEARRRLTGRLAADSQHADPLSRAPSGWPGWLAGLLALTPGDAGCEVTFQEVDSYVSTELSGVGCPSGAIRFVVMVTRPSGAGHHEGGSNAVPDAGVRG
jgi:hypothetical protein